MGKLIDIEITDAEYPNYSLGEYEGNIYRFKNGLIGQKVSIKRGKVKGGYNSAKLVEILENSYLQMQGGCPKSLECGGCRYQNLSYDNEKKYKESIIKKLFHPIFTEDIKYNFSPILSGYRNKMEYSFGDEEKGGVLTLGLHKKNRFYEILDNIGCNIVNDSFNKIREYTQQFFRDKNIPHYHRKRNDGELKFLIVRYSFYKNEIMLNLVTKTRQFLTDDILQEYVKNVIIQDFGAKVVSIFNTISNSIADAVVPEKVEHIYGKKFLEEKINSLFFNISPFSFFQPNPKSAELMYDRALELAGDISDKLVYDLYCGTGTISQVFARKSKKVIGVEIVEEAVEKARENAKLNNLENVEFIANDVLLEIDNLTQKPDILVLDPPREGIHPKAIDKIISMNAQKVVYISCNPKTQVRDLHLFVERGYYIKNVEIFDQFPRTMHVETVALLCRKDINNHIEVKLELDEEDITKAESKGTYENIKEYVLDNYGFKVSTLYIAQIKRKCGLELGGNYNKSKKENQVVPECPKEKEEAIMDALRYFGTIVQEG